MDDYGTLVTIPLDGISDDEECLTNVLIFVITSLGLRVGDVAVLDIRKICALDDGGLLFEEVWVDGNFRFILRVPEDIRLDELARVTIPSIEIPDFPYHIGDIYVNIFRALVCVYHNRLEIQFNEDTRVSICRDGDYED